MYKYTNKLISLNQILRELFKSGQYLQSTKTPSTQTICSRRIGLDGVQTHWVGATMLSYVVSQYFICTGHDNNLLTWLVLSRSGSFV